MLARTHGFIHRVAAATGLVFVGGTSVGGDGDDYTSVSLTSLTGGIASAPAAGDIVVVVHGWCSASDDNPTISGYTEVTELYANDDRDTNVVVAYKVMTGTPDTAITVPNTATGDNAQATVVHVWRSQNAAPIDVAIATATGTNSDVPNAPTVTPITTGAVILACALSAQQEANAALTVPSGYGNFFAGLGESGTTERQARAVIASKAWTGGAEDPPVFGGGSAEVRASWGAVSVVLRPSSSSGLVFVGGTTAGGRGDTYTSVSLTSLTGGIAAAPGPGDVVIVVHGCIGTSDVDPSVSGYTELTELYANDDVDANVAVAWKIMGPTPDTSVTVFQDGTSSNGHATAIHVWRGAHQTTPFNVTTTTATGTNSDKPDSPTITPTTAGSMVLSVGLGAQDDTIAATLVAPTGYTDNDFVSKGDGSTRSAIAVIASKAWVSGAEDPGAWTGGEVDTSNSWVAATLVLQPA